jgi:uncharacterized protein YggT (Ycf19 family)
MEFLNQSIKILSFLGAAFFLIFSYLCLLWSNRDKKNLRNIFAALTVSALYTFLILFVGFFLILITSFFLDKPLS